MTPEQIFEEAISRIQPIGQNKQEIVPVLETLKNNIVTGNFLEIGTQFGSTFYMLSKIYTNKKISVDLPLGIHGGLLLSIMNNRNQILQDEFENTHMITGNSRHTSSINQVKDILSTELLDLLFIDGDHTYEGVEQDYLNYRQFVRPGGLVVFHDIVDRPENIAENVGVPDFWKQLSGQKIEFICNCSWTHFTPVIGGLGILIV